MEPLSQNPETDQQLLRALYADFAVIGLVLERIALESLKNRVTRFPIFVAHTQPVGLGVPIFNKAEYALGWDYNASILEELVKKGVLEGARLADFRRAYTDPTERACFLIADPGFFHFVFVPYRLLDAGNPQTQ
ncbi:MAG: hypothetical protein ACK5QE_08460 [Sphingobacteriia bacterium]|jgi:hypothetical protein